VEVVGITRGASGCRGTDAARGGAWMTAGVLELTYLSVTDLHACVHDRI
jgi:hypothetical protein